MTSPRSKVQAIRARVARRRQRRGSRRGIALVMVLAAITVLTVMLTDFQDETSADLSAAVADRDSLKAEYLARSGVNLARLLIASEPTIRSAIAPLFMMMRVRPPQIPVWEFSDRVLGAFNDAQGAQEFQALAGVDLSQGVNLGIEGGRFEVVIVDEDAKINANVAARGDAFSQQRMAVQLMGLMAPPQYNSLFEARDRDDQFSDRTAICSALIDWADFDENMFNCDPSTSVVASSTATEDSFYSMLKYPYARKNAAFDSLEELRMVRGMGDAYWSTFVDPEPGNPRKRVMTVWGQGAVNVNTANPQTLLAIICAAAVPGTPLCNDPAQAETFVSMLGLVQGFTAGAPLFSSAKDFIRTLKGQGLVGPMLEAVGIQPVQLLSEAETEKMVTTESKVFSIYADGVVPGFRRETRVRIHAVVDFRNAPEPGYGPMPSDAAGATGMTGSTNARGGATAGTVTVAASADGEQGITAALTPNPGGKIIYFRID